MNKEPEKHHSMEGWYTTMVNGKTFIDNSIAKCWTWYLEGTGVWPKKQKAE